MLAYRAGYGAGSFNALLRADGTNTFTDDLDMYDGLDHNNIDGVDDMSVSQDVSSGQLSTRDPRTDAVILGASDPGNQTVLGNDGNRLKITNAGGVQVVDGAGNGTPFTAGNITVGSVTARGAAIFGGSVTSAGMSTSGGHNIGSTGSIEADGDFVVVPGGASAGGFLTQNGSFNTTNGNLSAMGGTVFSKDLVIGGNASVGNTVRFGTTGAGWFYNIGPNEMLLGKNSNLTIGGASGCDLTGATGTVTDDCRVSAAGVTTAGRVEAGKLKINAQQAPGATCLASTFATDSEGRMMECDAGVYRLLGGVRTTTVRNSSIAFSGQAATIACPAGYKLVGGGWLLTQRNTPATDPYSPSKSFGNAGANSWTVENTGAFGGNTAGFQAQVVCAKN
jgi:hypothetical protein